MQTIDEYIESLKSKKQQKLFAFFHQLLSTYPNLKVKMAYKVPFYYQNTWVMYLNPLKDESLEVAFVRAIEMDEEYRLLLDFKNRKQVAGIHFDMIDDEKLELFSKILQVALELDRKVKYKSKRTSNNKKSH